MAIFKKNEPQVQKPRERPAPTARNQGDAAISIIGSGMEVVGDISTEGIVRVEGRVRGTIRAGTAVVLGQAGIIEGNVLTQDAVIGGRVSGAIVASNRLELQSTCTVDGEIRTRAEHLKLEEGARFSGQVQMTEDEVASPEQPFAVTPAESGHLGTNNDFGGSGSEPLLLTPETGEGETEEEEEEKGRKKAEAH